MNDIVDWLDALLDNADQTQVWPKAAQNARDEIVRLRAREAEHQQELARIAQWQQRMRQRLEEKE